MESLPKSTKSRVLSSQGGGRFLFLVVAWVALLLAGAVLFFVIGALRDPTGSLHGMVGSALWTTLGPHFVLVSLFALGLGIFAGWRRPTLIALFAVWAAGAAGAGSVMIVWSFVFATSGAGGQVNVIRALYLRPMTGGGPDEITTVTTVNGRVLQAAIYRPREADGLSPVILYIHGGGFMTGHMTETDADLRWFADRGWLVVSADYRVFSEGAPTWDRAPSDVACAAAWVAANAGRLGGDIDRLALLGDSAGGNLAINLAYMAARGDTRSDCGTVPVPAAVVVQYPAVDPLAIYEHGYPVRGFEPRMLVRGHLGGDPQAFPERVDAVSSFTFLHAQAPPTLILSPKKDGLVPAWSVVRFAEYAEAAGVEVELVRLPFANHVYNQLAANSLGNQARRSITVRYLAERGLAPSFAGAKVATFRKMPSKQRNDERPDTP
ncbi:MAG: alpha/beta hydrolase [Opitutales bacterium]|nr:alpha/beta hydrolase [Opitutales bacterium]